MKKRAKKQQVIPLARNHGVEPPKLSQSEVYAALKIANRPTVTIEPRYGMKKRLPA